MEKFQLVQEFIAYLENLGYRPHLTIDMTHPFTHGIPESVKAAQPKGSVTFNVSQTAAPDLRIGMYQCQASMRFNGVHADVAWHPDAIQVVHAPGPNTPHMIFPVEHNVEEVEVKTKPTLKVVK